MKTSHDLWEANIQIPTAQTAFLSVEGSMEHGMEDRLHVVAGDDNLKACIADGHWGDGAAQEIVDFWANEAVPTTRVEAIEKTTQLQTHLYDLYGKPKMDAEKDKDPEAAFIAVNIGSGLLDVTSYGDCRLLVVNDHKVRYELDQEKTWLGAFSHLGLRDRHPVPEALVADQIPLIPGDYVALFTDGLDEWVYDEPPTISSEEIAETFNGNPADIIKILAGLAFANDAKDDLSVLIHRV